MFARVQVKREFAKRAGTGDSDHLTILAAMDAWSAARREGGRRHEREFCSSSFLSLPTLYRLMDIKRQFLRLLLDIGFLARGGGGGGAGGARRGGGGGLPMQWANRNGRNYPLLRGVMTAALYPNVARSVPLEGHIHLQPTGAAGTK